MNCKVDHGTKNNVGQTYQAEIGYNDKISNKRKPIIRIKLEIKQRDCAEEAAKAAYLKINCRESAEDRDRGREKYVLAFYGPSNSDIYQ